MKAWWNLTKEEKIKRCYHCSIGSFIIAALLFVYLTIACINTNGIVSKCTAEITGKTVSVISSSKYHSASLTAKFCPFPEADGAYYYAKGLCGDDVFWEHIKSKDGVPVTIHYNPENPEEAYACNSPEKPNVIVWAFVAIVMGVGGWLFIWQGKALEKSLGNNQDSEKTNLTF